MTILVTGGAGYIGSHISYALCDDGQSVVVLDDLSTGLRALVPPQARFIQGRVQDASLVKDIITDFGVDAVMHLAASVVVPESVQKPLDYYLNNTEASRSLIATCVASGVKYFIFSSTAAVYGNPVTPIVTEATPTVPISPYGRSKLMVEQMLEDTAKAYNFHYITLRYFNVAGADPTLRTGQSSPEASHLMKRVCQAALGVVDRVEIFGTDYPTPDGTCVRDYIHVSDIARAHLLALNSMRQGQFSATYNCGYGHGFSVRELVTAVEKVIGKPIICCQAPRREGDVTSLYANSNKLRSELDWQPNFDDLSLIAKTALQWEVKSRQFAGH